MSAGCEFICKNEDCPNYDTGFTITGPWPLGQIGLIIRASNLKKMETFKESLIKMKEAGKKYACITLPNIDDIPIEGYRIQKWCKICHCVWNYDVMCDEETLKKGWAYDVEGEHNDSSQETSCDGRVPEVCPKCNNIMLEFEKVIEDGILCPACNELLFQSRWFSNKSEGKKDE